MRISTDPTDQHYIDARPRRAWCNDVLIEGWTVADEFRRCVITPTKVHNGSVMIERLSDGEAEPEAPAVTGHTDAGFTGMFVNVPDVSPVPADAPVPAVTVAEAAKQSAHGKPKRR